MTMSPNQPQPPAGDGSKYINSQPWADVPRLLKESRNLLPEPWEAVFGPLRKGKVDDLVVIAQCGQSIDARIATESGHSHYISGPDGLAHLHRLRALVDVVVVGVGTVNTDDPQLTVRRVAGDSPARTIIDPNGRLLPSARCLAPDGVRRIVLTRDETKIDLPPDVEIVRLRAADGRIAPSEILMALADRGFRRILIEGGATTVSHFLANGCLDRLHVVIAPLIIGAGLVSVNLPPIVQLNAAIRAPMRAHTLGEEVLLDCDLSAHRIGIGRAKTSR
jgi:riboflavin-specific deaminase-like protein